MPATVDARLGTSSALPARLTAAAPCPRPIASRPTPILCGGEKGGYRGLARYDVCHQRGWVKRGCYEIRQFLFQSVCATQVCALFHVLNLKAVLHILHVPRPHSSKICPVSVTVYFWTPLWL